MQNNDFFSYHHVGGRNGRSGFPLISALHGSIASTFYEADTSCIPQIEAEQRSFGYGEVRVLPACLAGSNGVRSFNINFDGYTSSYLNLNPKYKSFYQERGGAYDYTYECAMSVANKLEISMVTLDDVQDKLPIDFLSLDTQGSELDILQGAVESLKNSVGVETEVSFRQIYENSALFGEICSFLNNLGFEFICFTSLTLDAPRTMPLVGRLEKLHSSGDALFLRIPKSTLEEKQKKKLIFAALAYGQIEYAAYCVRELGLKPSNPDSASQSTLNASSKEKREKIVTWLDFVDEFILISTKSKTYKFAPKLSELTNVKELAARFDLSSTTNNSPIDTLRNLKRLTIMKIKIAIKKSIKRLYLRSLNIT